MGKGRLVKKVLGTRVLVVFIVFSVSCCVFFIDSFWVISLEVVFILRWGLGGVGRRV